MWDRQSAEPPKQSDDASGNDASGEQPQTGDDSGTVADAPSAMSPRAVVLDPTLRCERAHLRDDRAHANGVSLALWTQCSEKSEIANWMPVDETVEILMRVRNGACVQYDGSRATAFAEFLTVQPQWLRDYIKAGRARGRSGAKRLHILSAPARFASGWTRCCWQLSRASQARARRRPRHGHGILRSAKSKRADRDF